MASSAAHAFRVVFVALVAMVPVQCAVTTPAPFAFRSGGYNDAKATKYDYPEANDLGSDFPAVDGRAASVENVVYVDKTDYDELAAKSSASDPGGAREPLDGESGNPDRFSRLGAIGPVELYRLLALGRQQESDIGLQFGGILNKITHSLPSSPDDVNHCPDRPEIGIQYYCMKLEDGLYYDPWNPWCGFIKCRGGIAERICCKKGTWLGPSVMFQPFYKTNQKAMCRRPLRSSIMDGKCPMPSTKDICKAAIKVEKMNPPNPRPDATAGQFSKIDLAQFSRLQSRLAPSPQPGPPATGGAKATEQSDASSVDDGNAS